MKGLRYEYTFNKRSYFVRGKVIWGQTPYSQCITLLCSNFRTPFFLAFGLRRPHLPFYFPEEVWKSLWWLSWYFFFLSVFGPLSRDIGWWPKEPICGRYSWGSLTLTFMVQILTFFCVNMITVQNSCRHAKTYISPLVHISWHYQDNN